MQYFYENCFATENQIKLGYCAELSESSLTM